MATFGWSDPQLELKSFVFGKDQLGKDIIEYWPLAKVTPILRWFMMTFRMLTSLLPIISLLPGAKLAMIRGSTRLTNQTA